MNPTAPPADQPRDTPPAPPAIAPAAADAAPFDAIDARRRTRRLVLLLFSGTVLTLLLAYIVVLKRSEGDYLINERGAWVMAMRMNGLPRWTFGLNGKYTGPAFWIALPDGVGFAGKLSTGAGWTESATGVLTRVRGERDAYLLDSSWSNSFEQRVERFPADSLQPLSLLLMDITTASPVDILREARSIHAQLPDRLTTKYWLVAALAYAGETAEATRRLAEWRAEFVASRDPRAPWLLYLMENDVLAATPKFAMLRGEFAPYITHMGTRPTLDEMVEWLSGLEPEDLPREFSLDQSVANFLAFQVTIKTARVWAVLLMADGRRDAANRLLQGSATFGAVQAAPFETIAALIAIASRAIVMGVAVDVYVHAEWTAAELETLWREWESLWERLPRHDSEGMMRAFAPEIGDLASLKARVATLRSTMRSYGGEGVTRLIVVEARRELLREGMRVRHFATTRGAWPAIGTDASVGGLLLPAAAAPVDPFETPPRPLRAAATTDTLTLWSIGPDGTDDRASVTYDPTNGTLSAGDVVLAIDRVPRFRFPTEPGYAYAGRADFDARYPHGLPLDPYSNNAAAPLRLTTDGTHILWSYGPDADEGVRKRRLPPDPQVEDLYDPTNGLTSRGDLYLKLHFRE